MSWMNFQEIIELLNFLYALGMLLELAAFVVLRLQKPDLPRPYRVPLKTFWASMLCVPPTFLLFLVMCLATLRTFFISGAIIAFGFILHPILARVRDRKWMAFEGEYASLLSNHRFLHSQSDPADLEVKDELLSPPLLPKAEDEGELSLVQSSTPQDSE